MTKWQKTCAPCSKKTKAECANYATMRSSRRIRWGCFKKIKESDLEDTLDK